MNNRIIPQNNLAIREYAQSWVNIILEKYKQKVRYLTPPICEETLRKVIEELKETNIAFEQDKKTSAVDEGLLMPIKGGFIIKYGTLKEFQKRFHYVKIRETICHELAHILFYDCSFSIPRLKVTPPEHLCHDIARKLLIPEQAIRERFSEKNKVNFNLIDLIKQLSRGFQVAIMLMARRLTEDLSLLNDTMITFWKHEDEKGDFSNNQIHYKRYRRIPKLSPNLNKLLPKYWRDRVHTEAWNKVVSKVAIGEASELSESLYVEGKKRKKGRIKSIPFRIQCAPLYDRAYKLNFYWRENTKPILNIISVKKFDLNILENGK